MISNPYNSVPSKNRAFRTILFAGFLVGTLDILAAFVDYNIATGKGPEGVLRFIASGVFGMEAFSGGGAMILLGLIFHFIIAFSFTLLFYWLFLHIKFIQRNTILSAVLYGIFIWMMMNLIVLPLSNTPKRPFQFNLKSVKAIIILICMIGVPLSLIMRTKVKNKR